MLNRQKRVLVLKGEDLSQFVEAEPSFAAIRKQHPDAQIDLLTTSDLGRLAKGAPYFDRVLAAGAFPDTEAKKRFLSQLRKMGYSAVYDLDGTKRSFEIKKALTGFRGVTWVGPKKQVAMNRSALLAPPFAAPAMRKLLAEADILVDGRLPDLSWALQGRKDAANMQPSWYGINLPYALLIPARDPKKRWSAEHYVQLNVDLMSRGITPVMVGNGDVRAFGDEVSQLMVREADRSGEGHSQRFIDLTEKTDLAQLAALARQASFFVAGVSEEIHLTASIGCPGVLLIHPSDNRSSDTLLGRNVVRIAAENMSNLDVGIAMNTLKSMGLIAEKQPLPTSNTPPVYHFN